MWIRFLLFLLLNFGALALGSWLMGGNPGTNLWYQQLNKAPWTPPGWVFGAAWFSIMVFFSFFMARITADKSTRQRWILLFYIQFILNVGWNPVFFRWHQLIAGLVVIMLLQVILLVMFKTVPTNQKTNRLLLIPYIAWLFVAISLNAWPVL